MQSSMCGSSRMQRSKLLLLLLLLLGPALLLTQTQICQQEE
jgi:hypothetical protein